MSKFSGLKDAQRQRLEQNTPSPAPLERSIEVAPRKVGRPRGKRSDPDYQQVTALLYAPTYLRVRQRLLTEKREVSELLNELLSEWLKT